MLQRKVGSAANGEAVDPKIEKLKVTDFWTPFLLDRKNKGRGLEHIQRRWIKHVEPFFGSIALVMSAPIN